MPEFEVITELLMWIATGGGAAIIVGRVMSLLLEDAGWWHRLSPVFKKYFVRVLSVLFGVLAEALLEVDLSTVFGPYAAVVGTVVLALWNWLASQAQYLELKSKSYIYGEKAGSSMLGP